MNTLTDYRRCNMKKQTRGSMKIILLTIVFFFSCVAYGQTQPATTERVKELAQAEEIKQPPPSEPQRIDLGKIGVVVAGFRPQAYFGRPRTKGDVASDYAQQGAVFMLSAGMGGGLGGVGALMFAPVAAGLGAIFGAIRGESEGTIKETEDTLNGYLVSLDFQGTLLDRLLVESAEQTRHSLIPLDLRGPINRGEEVVYDVSSYPDIDTVLEIGVERCGLTGGSRDVNPDFSLSVGGQIRFVSAKDGKVLSTRQIDCSGNATHKFTEWANNNARPFKDEIDRIFPCLAKRIIEEVSYLEEHPPVEQSEKQEVNEEPSSVPVQDDLSL
jgi:hypothetical protein